SQHRPPGGLPRRTRRLARRDAGAPRDSTARSMPRVLLPASAEQGRLRSTRDYLGARDGGRAPAAPGPARPRPGTQPAPPRRAAAGLRAVPAGPPAAARPLGRPLAPLAGLLAAP